MLQPAGHASGVATGNPVFTYDGAATVEHIASGRGSEVDLTEPSMLSMGKKHRVAFLHMPICVSSCTIEKYCMKKSCAQDCV